MRFTPIQHCSEGMVLAKTIFSESGQTLIREDVKLTRRMIDTLQHLGINFVYVRDARTSDVEVKEMLTEQTRMKAMKTIKEEFHKIGIKDRKFTSSIISPEFTKSFKSTVQDILNDIMNSEGAVHFLTDIYIFDHYIFQHSLNVTCYTLLLARSQDYNQQQLAEIGLGAILHDIGKLKLPMDILQKPGSLTDEEYALVKEHTVIGFDMLRKMHDIPLLCSHCAFQHHERMDGTGYPRGIKGDEMHPYAKMIAIADVFDALTTNRSYRKAMLPHEAIEVLYAGAGTLFDLDLVDAFKYVITLYPTGIPVKLNDGTEGIVVGQNKGMPSRPVVRVFKDESGQELDTYYEIDLGKQLTMTIQDCNLELYGNEAGTDESGH
ncbi:HD-GYP domain-containing protein [Marinicrinis sediminis]|uniref:HD-GYP domain-containing protein n=1 Tax=Marinicrinis sediminis TaxID=1652465 RepID=A0ABW5RBI9_9BACL